MLSVNLDSIILFRFHALCLKAAALATILCITIILPINLTARCHNNSDPQCFNLESYALTNYEKTTLANIPPLEFGNESKQGNTKIQSGIWGSTYPELLIRLYAIVFCSWIITVFTCRLIGKEWVASLAMRRVYYLEADIWGKRKEELHETLLKDDHDEDGIIMDEEEDGKDDDGVERAPDEFKDEYAESSRRLKRRKSSKRSSVVDCARDGKRRDPWIPHPEQRDTVPNIELYSVLVGGLPSLPSEVVDEQDMEQAALGFSRRQSIDWQLAVATTFFDHCVPNQPGYSSSVAAVTILPDAPELARAWRRWYVAAAAVRRLRFIRSVIADRRHYDIELGEEEEEEEEEGKMGNSVYSGSENNDVEMQTSQPKKSKSLRFKSFRMGSINENQAEAGGVGGTGNISGNNSTAISSGTGIRTAGSTETDSKAIYLDAERRMSYYRKVYGATDDEDVESHLYQALDYGPEQSAQYSREAAQGAATCCPNGCGEERLRQLPIDELIDMEEEAFQAVQDANVNLRYAQAQAAVSTIDTNHAKMHLPEKGNSEDIVQHAEEDQKHAKMNSMHANFYAFNIRSHDESTDLAENTTSNGGTGGMSGGLMSNVDSFASSPRHLQSASLDCINLPENLAMETQLLARYNKKDSGVGSNTNGESDGTLGSALGGGTQHRKTVSCFDPPNPYSEEIPHNRRNSDPNNLSPSSQQQQQQQQQNGQSTVVGPFHRTASAGNAGFEMYERSTLASALEGGEGGGDRLPLPPTTKKGATPPLPPSNTGINDKKTPFPSYTSRDSSHPLLVSTSRNNSDAKPSSRGSSVGTVPVSRVSSGTTTNNNNNTVPVSRVPSHNTVPVSRATSNGASSVPASASSLSSNTAGAATGRRSSSVHSNVTRSSLLMQHGKRQSVMKRQSMAMTSEGKIQFVQEDLLGDSDEEDDNTFFSPRVRSDIQRSRSIMMRGAAASRRNLLGENDLEDNEDDDKDEDIDRWCDSPKRSRDFSESENGDDLGPMPIHSETNVPTRRRANTAESSMGMSMQWAQVEQIIADDGDLRGGSSTSDKKKKRSTLASGIWQPLKLPSAKDLGIGAKKKGRKMMKWASSKTTDVVDDLARDSTFAVVTFTSRQAAVAARHCLADGRGADRWLSNKYLPVPPLADAAPCDIITCRGCCRPVTVSLNEKQKMVRKYATIAMLATLYIFYTFPISLAAGLADPEKLYELWPGLEKLSEQSVLFSKLLSGIVPALLYTLFFACCPVIFKAISNFGSNGESQQVAEHCALKYYWWFMVITAFSSSSLLTLALNAINTRQLSGSDIADVLATIATTIPTQISATWLNWIIVRLLITLPLQYMIQMNTFCFDFMGWRCCARCVKGGGPGGPIPYRIYIDSGVVLLCTFALAPASPLVAPCALLYFLYCQPLWRRNCIFLYRPKFDSGGLKWPFLSDMCISGMIVGQILLSTMMALKEAVGPAVFAAIPIIPTILFRRILHNRFLRAYLDAGLLQTSLLDGWDNNYSTMEKREEFRQFLIDAHKAAYIPVCIAGGATSALTAEPAVTVPHENDEYDFSTTNITPNESRDHEDFNASHSTFGGYGGPSVEYEPRASNQFGASFRRVSTTRQSGVHAV